MIAIGNAAAVVAAIVMFFGAFSVMFTDQRVDLKYLKFCAYILVAMLVWPTWEWLRTLDEDVLGALLLHLWPIVLICCLIVKMDLESKRP